MRKILICKFRENFKNGDFGAKITHFHHFGNNRSFPLKSKAVTFSHFLMLNQVQFHKNLENRLREKFKNIVFEPHNDPFTPLLDVVRIFLKNHTLNHFLMLFIRYNFKNIKSMNLAQSSKVLILYPKLSHLHHVGHKKDFPQKRVLSMLCIY